MKAEIIPEWKQAWRYLTVQLLALVAVLDTAYAYLPMLQEYLPDHWVRWACLVVIIGRIVKVSYEPTEPKPADTED